jgi:methionyl-tRNA formyltransferase
MKILLAGQKTFGREALKTIAALGHEIVAVAAPANHSTEKEMDKLLVEATLRRLPIIPSGTLNADTLPPGTDLIVAAHSHDFIGEKTRLRAKHGAIGYHPSLLPIHRGRDAVPWTIKNRERITGGTVYWLSNTVDGGPIAAQEHVFVRPEDTALELWIRELAPLGLKLLAQVITDISKGRITKEPQDPKLATWEPALTGQPRLYRPDLIMLEDHGRP